MSKKYVVINEKKNNRGQREEQGSAKSVKIGGRCKRAGR